MQKKKKGFTLVELLVVIAILAILAGVSVVGYLSFTNKANQSADEQAVTQMNTILQAEGVSGEIDSILDVYRVFDENGLKAKDYSTLMKGTGFYWHKTKNIIVILDENDKQIIYPEHVKNEEFGAGTLYSLNGTIDKDEEYVVEKTPNDKITKAIITNGNEFYDLVDKINNEPTKYEDEVTIKINNDIDLYGVSGLSFDGEKKDIVIEGNSSTRAVPTISGITSYKNDFISPDTDGVMWKYSYGLIPTVKNHNVTIKNINFNGLEFIGEYGKSLGIGLLIGQVYANSCVTIENVNIYNSKVSGTQFVGGFIGRVIGLNAANDTDTVKVSIKNSSINSSVVEATFGQNAGVIGGVVELGKFSLAEKEDPKLAMERIKNNLIIENVNVNNVTLPVTDVQSVEIEFKPEYTVSHAGSVYNLNNTKNIKGGIYDYGTSYGFFSTAKLFNINPTFKHDAYSSLIENYKHNGREIKFNCALFPINDYSELDNINITKLA